MKDTLKAEAQFWWQSFWRPCRPVLLACIALFFVLGLWDLATADAYRPGDWWGKPLGGALAGVVFGAMVGGTVGGVMLLYRLVGPWFLVPLVLVPGGIIVALWMGSGLIEARFDAIWEALVAAGREHEWLILGVGGGAVHGGGAVLVVLLLPFLLLDLGMLILTPAVLLQVLYLLLAIAGLVAAGGIPPALGSAVVLSFAFVRRFKERHPRAPARSVP